MEKDLIDRDDDGRLRLADVVGKARQIRLLPGQSPKAIV
jgi:hypothetical protein